jgi:carboxyl-terminal processing protease
MMDSQFRLTAVIVLILCCCFPANFHGQSPGTLHDDGLSRPDTGQRRGDGEPASRRDSHRKNSPINPIEIFYQAIDIINQFYASEVSNRVLLDAVLNRLQLMMLPQCGETMRGLEDCQSSPEKCFLDILEEAAVTCGLDLESLVLKSIALLTRCLDANSSLLDQGMLNELSISTSGKFGGVGMVVTARADQYVVVSSLDGSPAQRAGISAGDTILEIDGRRLRGLSLPTVLGMVRGPSGSMMSILVESGKTKKTKKINIKRQTIRIAPVRGTVLSEGIAYIRIVNFQEDTNAELQRVFMRLLANNGRNFKGIILDVRDNPGGLFEEAIKVASLFKSQSLITSLRGRNPNVTRDFFSPLEKSLFDGPIVVLTNDGSASGSEILVGALQGMPNVRIMGQRTFGKASVQGVFPLTDSLALRLTTAHYYTADGRDIEGRGIDPDTALDVGHENTTARVGKLNAQDLEADPLIRVALQYIVTKKLPSRSPFESLF